jgi:PRTRC genetic system protein E
MIGHPVMSISQRRSKSVFVELMPLLKQRTLLITVARIDEKLKVNVIPAKAKQGEDEALTTPLSYTGSPEKLDREFGQHLASYVDSHLALGSTLAEAKAEMDAAAKAARQKAKTAQPTSKSDTGSKKEESATPVAAPADTTPTLFPAQTQTEKPATETSAPECRLTE